jgi:hypothetical protein
LDPKVIPGLFEMFSQLDAAIDRALSIIVAESAAPAAIVAAMRRTAWLFYCKCEAMRSLSPMGARTR